MKDPVRIVFLGPPGAGKGTQAVLLSKQRGIPHISTGNILREAVAAKSELGLKVKTILDSGDLVSDEIMIQLIRERLAQPDCVVGFILDGFPRTVDQARALDTVLEGMNKSLTHVLDLKVPESVLLERIRSRGVSGSGRSDDSHEVAARRLQVYWAQTAPVTQYYREGNRVVEVSGLGTVDEVAAALLKVIS